jgi:hypothetical protein
VAAKLLYVAARRVHVAPPFNNKYWRNRLILFKISLLQGVVHLLWAAMPNQSEKIAHQSFIEFVDHCFERRLQYGELVLPAVFGALQLLPFEEQEKIGTLMRHFLVEQLLQADTGEKVMAELEAGSIQHVIRSLLQRIGISLPQKKSMKKVVVPSMLDEMHWLAEHVNRSSPTQCFIMSDILAKTPDTFPRAKEWYVKGIEAAKNLSEEYRHLVFSIFE